MAAVATRRPVKYIPVNIDWTGAPSKTREMSPSLFQVDILEGLKEMGIDHVNMHLEAPFRISVQPREYVNGSWVAICLKFMEFPDCRVDLLIGDCHFVTFDDRLRGVSQWCCTIPYQVDASVNIKTTEPDATIDKFKRVSLHHIEEAMTRVLSAARDRLAIALHDDKNLSHSNLMAEIRKGILEGVADATQSNERLQNSWWQLREVYNRSTQPKKSEPTLLPNQGIW